MDEENFEQVERWLREGYQRALKAEAMLTNELRLGAMKASLKVHQEYENGAMEEEEYLSTLREILEDYAERMGTDYKTPEIDNLRDFNSELAGINSKKLREIYD